MLTNLRSVIRPIRPGPDKGIKHINGLRVIDADSALRCLRRTMDIHFEPRLVSAPMAAQRNREITEQRFPCELCEGGVDRADDRCRDYAAGRKSIG
jgi:hypothetical protein